jgi:hypothetical protein
LTPPLEEFPLQPTSTPIDVVVVIAMAVADFDDDVVAVVFAFAVADFDADVVAVVKVFI